MTLAELVALIRDEMNKKSLTDEQIKAKIRTALRSLEMKEEWNYMRKVFNFTLNPANANPRQIAQPTLIKKLDFIRYAGEDGRFNNLVGVDADAVIRVETSEPTGYYKSGFDFFIVDNTPPRIISGEIFAAQFTQWPTTPSEEASFAPWMLTVCHPLLLYETIILLAPFLRELELLQVYGQLRSDMLTSALVMNEEYEYGDQRLWMEYGDGRSY